VITQNTTLDSDVGPCPGDGIVIGASNITLDLAQFRVLGMGSPSSVGIRVREPHHRVRITNGTVAGFDQDGVSVWTSDNVIDRLAVRGNGFRIALQGNRNNQVRGNVIIGNLVNGIVTRVSSDNTIETNVIAQTRLGDGIFIGGSVVLNGVVVPVSGNRVIGNSILNNARDGVLTSSTSAEIRGNSIRNNRGNGVFGITANINLPQCCAVIHRNHIFGNGANGVLVQGTNNTIVANTALANRRFDLADANPACDANIWTGNRFGTRNQPCIK
ncbi:MAG TPA: right-handed parallel beta-helix repeat-containing protein, partial [Acidimicrobiia bacterium]|nr:right-handed parallel beta-helix repeat-containing protein [Acidimicrobiia bacterium]